ncbi:MAG TPA: hypothetical protein VFA04_27735 [Bryobacteraceae bacterium]|nr:hypothetical protein [Bryobacteraceae bacterium]
MTFALKSWLELRRRISIAAAVWVFILIAFMTPPAFGPSHANDGFRAFAWVDTVMLVCFGAMLAGNGVMTQSCGWAGGRMADSVLFTLSLPFSRRRLFLARAGQGAIALLPTVVLFWALLPLLGLRQPVWPHALIRALPFQLLTGMVGYSAALLGLCLFSETVFGFVVGGVGAIAGLGSGLEWPPSRSILDFASGATYVITGHISWTAVAACVVLSCLFVVFAVRAIERREF